MALQAFCINSLTKQLQKLTIKTKWLIAIIIVSFDNNKRVDYNENDYNGDNNKQVLIVIGKNDG